MKKTKFGKEIVERTNADELGDFRQLPKCVWQDKYFRFKKTIRSRSLVDLPGAYDSADEESGTKAITVLIFQSLTGKFICKVDIGFDLPSATKPMTIHDVAFEVER